MKTRVAIFILAPTLDTIANNLLKTLSEIPLTSRSTTGHRGSTAAYGIGHLNIDEVDIMFLVPPEAMKFNFFWKQGEFLQEINATYGGIIALCSPSRPEWLRETNGIFETLKTHSSIPFIFAANVQSSCGKTTQQENTEKSYLDEMRQRLGKEIIVCDVENQVRAKGILISLLKQFEPNPIITSLLTQLTQKIVILVTGTLFAGKTEFFERLSGKPDYFTNIEFQLDTGENVGLGFYELKISPRESIYLLTGSGNLHYFAEDWVPALRRQFFPSHLGIILLFNPASPASFRDARNYIDRAKLTDAPYLVAANVRENEDMVSQNEYIEAMPKHWGIDKISVCNALDKESVKKVVVELLQMLPSESLTEQAILRVQAL